MLMATTLSPQFKAVAAKRNNQLAGGETSQP